MFAHGCITLIVEILLDYTINLISDKKFISVTKRGKNVANTSWLRAKHYSALFLQHSLWNFKEFIT